MEVNTYKPGAKDCEIEEPIFYCRHSMAMEMKSTPLKKYSVLLIFLVMLSLGSTVTRLQSYSIRFRTNLNAESDVEAGQLVHAHLGDEIFWCDRSDNRTDICYMRGNVHLVPGTSTSLVLYSRIDRPWHGNMQEIIWPYARKWDSLTLNKVERVVLRTETIEPKQTYSDLERSAICDVVHRRPLLVFSTGGYAGNPYHDFNDVIIPLFINSQQYGGEIVFGITDVRDWWMEKFSPLFRLLSKHKIINIDTTDQIHCFREATVGLRVHAELAIYPSRMANNETIKDFQHLIHQAFGGPDSDELMLKDNTTSSCLVANVNYSTSDPCQLKLVIFARKQSRIILNQDQVLKVAGEEGFEVEVLEPSGVTTIRSLYRSLQIADVMIGVHGAALTHMLFMRPRSVFIQIVPLGTDWPAYTYYQEPAENMLDLQYLEYRVSPEESTLTRTYKVDDVAVTDPEAVIAANWETRKKMYMEGQDVRLSLPKVQSILREAKSLAFKAFPRRRR